MAQIYNFSFVQGDTHSFVVEWRDANDAPFDLSGYSVRLQIKEDYSTAALVTLTNGNGIVLDGVNGRTTVTFTAAQTGGLAVASYVYDMQFTSPASVVTTLVQGQATCTPQVTTNA